jgi:hypothetical protein
LLKHGILRKFAVLVIYKIFGNDIDIGDASHFETTVFSGRDWEKS